MIQRHNTRNARDQYRELRKQEKKKVHIYIYIYIYIYKKTYQEEQLKEVENLNSQKESRRFLRKVNLMRSGFQPRNSFCRYPRRNPE
jgi:hypothetical protein